MRLDKFLKVSRIIKRRTVANEICDASKIMLEGRTLKASYNVKPGDILEITIAGTTRRYKVLGTEEHKGKDSAREMYEILS